jgi:hypothetical protein
MTDTQHTPGPWAVYRAVQNEGEFIIHQGATDIAVTRWALGDCNANARLIAAAPDLLEILGDILPWLEKAEAEGVFENCSAPKGGQRAINRARAAIAKATGVQS